MKIQKLNNGSAIFVVIKIFIAFGVLSFASQIRAEEIYWYNEANGAPGKFSNPSAGCQATMAKIQSASAGSDWRYDFAYLIKNPYDLARPSLHEYSCRYTTFHRDVKGNWMQFNSFGANAIRVIRKGSTCPSGSIVNSDTYICESSSESQASMQNGEPESNACSAASKEIGVINFAVGNNYQVDEYLEVEGFSPIEFRTYYNSSKGIRSHTYSTYLAVSGDAANITLVKNTGKQSSFAISGASAKGMGTEVGYLSKSGSEWTYNAADNSKLKFNSTGKLVSVSSSNGVSQLLTYSAGNTVSVSDGFGNSLVVTQDAKGQPLSLNTAGLSAVFSYNSSGQLSRAELSRNGQTESRSYEYEVPGKPTLLTGITDERGVRFATWAYDDQNRVISSQQANGVGQVLISYNADGSSTVTNELGKQTTYRYQVIQGVKRITAIEGEPSAKCPASNSTYTYNDRGQVLTKTDAKGFITTYAYNDRGLETSRTEASGTPQARTTTTTWHATLNLPLTVKEGGQVTTYTYDAQGRQTSRTETAL